MYSERFRGLYVVVLCIITALGNFVSVDLIFLFFAKHLSFVYLLCINNLFLLPAFSGLLCVDLGVFFFCLVW